MKKKFKVSFLALIAAFLLPSIASAHDFEVDGIYYNITSDSEVAVTFKGNYYDSYTNEYTDAVLIPEKVTYSGTEYSVTSIGERAFWGCSGLTSVSIPNSVASIRLEAFYGCSGLTGTLTIPKSVTSISSEAFYGCSGLTGTLTIPNSVTYIYNSAFENCSGLKEIIIEDGFETLEIWSSAFRNVPVETLYMGRNFNTSNYIQGLSAFGNKKNLSKLTIGSFVTYIGNYEFYLCSGLTSITIPNSVTEICVSAFEECSGLTELSIGNSVTSIGKRAFQNCSGLTGSLTISHSVTTLGSDAFYDCNFNKVICEASTPPVIGDLKYSAFSFKIYNVPLLVPSASIPEYKEAYDWKKFKNISAIEVEATGITLDKTEATISVGESTQLVASVEPENVTDKTIVWTSSDETVATVAEDGTVTAVAVGTATITATCGEASATCKVTVNPVTASAITLNVEDMTLLVGASDKLTVTIEPENTTDPTVTWTSSDEEVATVAEDGTVTAVAVGTATITATCGEASATCNVTVNPVTASAITLNVEDMTLLVGASDKLTVTIEPENVTDKTIVWTSSDEKVATVAEDGTVTAVAVGTATITATCGEATATCKVTVNSVTASAVTLNVEDMTLLVGATDKLTVTIEPENTTDPTIVWTSSDEKVATVAGDGTVTAVAVGTATITATCGEVSATCKVTVNPVTASSITLNVEDMTLLVGASDKLTVTIEPENVTDKTIVWTSSDEAVATVAEDGTVTAIAVGTATITATCGEATATCKVTVLPIEAEKVTLDCEEAELTVGETLQLTATVEPDDTTDKTVVWSSSDEAVVTVDETGLVTAIAAGTATVTAACGTATATCTITVIEPSGIDSIIADGDGRIEVYTLSGVRVNATTAADLRTLRSGFYIVRQGSAARKIRIGE